jgi:8-oxo-dGTP pyrophosphatase MutT (NUDIX family)
MMKPGKVRATAICLIQHADRLLVTEYHDEVKCNTYYRPLGGAIEFGEYGSETVVRELMEEIDAKVENIRYLGTVENIFISNGQKGHQIMLVYSGDLTDRGFYDKPVLLAHEDDGQEFKAVWMPIKEFRQGRAIIYPDGILDLLPPVPLP